MKFIGFVLVIGGFVWLGFIFPWLWIIALVMFGLALLG